MKLLPLLTRTSYVYKSNGEEISSPALDQALSLAESDGAETVTQLYYGDPVRTWKRKSHRWLIDCENTLSALTGSDCGIVVWNDWKTLDSEKQDVIVCAWSPFGAGEIPRTAVKLRVKSAPGRYELRTAHHRFTSDLTDALPGTVWNEGDAKSPKYVTDMNIVYDFNGALTSFCTAEIAYPADVFLIFARGNLPLCTLIVPVLWNKSYPKD